MRELSIVLSALIKNKFRFGEAATQSKKAATVILLVFFYLLITAYVLLFTVYIGGTFADGGAPFLFYFVFMLIGSAVVLIFGIVNLVSTLFLCKDTDFYSMLPIKPTVVFAAKLLFVYISEAVIVFAVLLPAIITYGIVASAGAAYYLISLPALLIVPALPLALAAILAIPVMYIAGKLKNRNIVAIVFYIVVFVGIFALYMCLIFAMPDSGENITQAQLDKFVNVLTAVGYVLYPFTALSYAVFGVPTYGLGIAASSIINVLIFLGCSAVLFGLLLFLGRFMYAKSATANNQTSAAKAKKGEFKTVGSLKALIKREFAAAMRTTQTAFQCFSTYFLTLVFAVIIGLMFDKSFDSGEGAVNMYMISFACLAIMLPSTANAAFTTFSREGTAIETLKVLPVDVKQIVAAKSIAWGVPAVASAVAAAAIVNIFDFGVLQFILSVLSFAALASALIVFAVLWDLKAPKLKWTDPLQAIKHNTNANIGMLFSMIGGFAAVIVVIAFTVFENFTGAFAALWSLIFAEAVIFAVIDIILYRKKSEYFYRTEI